jgi:hypothetical protein
MERLICETVRIAGPEDEKDDVITDCMLAELFCVLAVFYLLPRLMILFEWILLISLTRDRRSS